MDYGRVKPDRFFWMAEGGKLLGLAAVLGILFYDAWYAGTFVLLLAPFLIRQDVEKYRKNVRRGLRDEFRDVIMLLAGNINAGYSLEHALIRADEDYARLAKDKSYMKAELDNMVHGLQMNRKAEELLRDFGKRSGIRIVRDFADLLAQAKTYGGNTIRLIEKTAHYLDDKHGTELEIMSAQAGKRFESAVMLFMPAYILAYMKLTNGEYLRPLYEQPMGRVIMTAGLLAMFAAGFWMHTIIYGAETEDL